MKTQNPNIHHHHHQQQQKTKPAPNFFKSLAIKLASIFICSSTGSKSAAEEINGKFTDLNLLRSERRRRRRRMIQQISLVHIVQLSN